MRYNSFHPGQVWLDTNGKRIHAHGGSILYENGRYYWYGENKEKTTGENGIWHWGIRCYVSDDLYNWEYLGLIIPPEPDDPASTLHPSRCVDRPHILHNARTGKYVCWLKVMFTDGTQRCTILVADQLLGPYTKKQEGLLPLGMSAGDFDLAVADDGKAYYYFERVHSELICADLTDDYTGLTGYYSTHFPHLGPPYTREAPAHFMRLGKHYLLTSGTTGYLPNPSELAVADSWHGPYRVLGDPHPSDESRTRFTRRFRPFSRFRAKRIFILPVQTAGSQRKWIFPMKPTAESSRICSTVILTRKLCCFRKKISPIPARITPLSPIMSGFRSVLTEKWPI